MDLFLQNNQSTKYLTSKFWNTYGSTFVWGGGGRPAHIFGWKSDVLHYSNVQHFQ
jgi:hypothetical protein